MRRIFPSPGRTIPVAEGAERDELREELRDLARNEIEMLQAAWDPEIAAQEAPLSRLDRDEVQAAPHRHAELMRREEESCFRQFVRLGNFLAKIQGLAAKCAKSEGASGYVDENTGGEQIDRMTKGPESVAPDAESCPQAVGSPRSEAGSGSPAEVGEAVAQPRVRRGTPSEVDQADALSRRPNSGFRTNPRQDLGFPSGFRKTPGPRFEVQALR